MRVLIDFTQIALSRTGVGVYADQLVTHLQGCLPTDDSLILVVQSDDRSVRERHQLHRNVRLVILPSRLFRNRLLLGIYEQVALPVLARLMRADLIHSLHYTHPLAALTPRVVTVHDLTHVLHPEMHTRARTVIMPFFLRRAMNHAEAVIFVSGSTQTDAERICPGARNLRCAVPLGVSAPSTLLVDKSQNEQVLAELRVSKPYLLFIGTLEPRKNIVRIVQAFERLARNYPELTLVVAGKLGWHTAEIVAAMENSLVRSRIRHVGFVSDEQKAVLLSGCEILVYPSLYEGFGLPVLEGMAAGAPVITSNISSMPEVAGGAALLVDPTSVDEIATAIRRILTEPHLAGHLRAAGCQQAKRFTWSRMADQTVDVYRSVVAENSA